jgi:hypothetical protein
VFSAVAEPIELCRGEIYQYVGDEIVITWVEADGVADARALRCFFAMRASLAADTNRFVQGFGVQPWRAGAARTGRADPCVLRPTFGSERLEERMKARAPLSDFPACSERT